MLRSLLLVVVFGWCQPFLGQTPRLSDQAEISVVTCAADPTVLYYSFGHTAFRVNDPEKGIDVVYNYGTFDFDQPNFYLNFTKGRLLYTLSRRRYDSFVFEYNLESRWVKQQVLALNPEEVNTLFRFFEYNYLPEHRDYLYDPLFDNCSTKVASLLDETFGPSIVYNDPGTDLNELGIHLPESPTLRDLVHSHLKTNTWGSFGIYLAFGAVVDRTATLKERMFLPYLAMAQLDETFKKGKPLVKRKDVLVAHSRKTAQTNFFITPLFGLILVFGLVFWATYRDWKHSRISIKVDFWLLLITGIAGLFLLFLWLATDHVYTKSNYNIFWLLPSNTIMAFFFIRKRPLPHWVSYYLWSALALMAFTMVLWVIQVQVFSPLIAIILPVLGIRYAFLLKHLS